MYTIEAFKDKIHLYANQQQARALLGRFSPQGYPRITITRWANLPIYNGFLEEVGLSQMVDPLEATLILLGDTKKHPPKEKPGYPLGAKTNEEKLLAIPGKHLKTFLRIEGLKSSGNKKSLVQRILTECHQGKVELMISLFFKPPRKKVIADQSIQGYLTSLEALEELLLSIKDSKSNKNYHPFDKGLGI